MAEGTGLAVWSRRQITRDLYVVLHSSSCLLLWLRNFQWISVRNYSPAWGGQGRCENKEPVRGRFRKGPPGGKRLVSRAQHPPPWLVRSTSSRTAPDSSLSPGAQAE